MRKKTHEEYVEELKIKNPTVEVVEEYVNGTTPIMHHCMIHDVYWKITPGNVLSGHGCNECKKDKSKKNFTKTHEQYVEEVAKVNPDIKVLGTYNGVFERILHLCTKHNVEWMAMPNNILQGYGCPECRKERCRSKTCKKHEDYVRELSVKNPTIDVVDEYINANTEIMHHCSIHNVYWYASPHVVLHGAGCPMCNESRGEKSVRLWLDNNDINYIQEKSFNDCRDNKPLPFDFYLPDYNACIEYQGKQHYESVDYFGGETSLEYTQKHDNIKKEYCKSNNIKLLCIPYYEDVNEQLNNFLFI